MRHSVYIPKKTDHIDNALASYVNLRPEDGQLKIMFLRESEGVYRFGSKRIYIKLDKGNQMKVRVGGGYMAIGEFIRTYTPLEIEKKNKKVPLNRFLQKLTA